MDLNYATAMSVAASSGPTGNDIFLLIMVVIIMLIIVIGGIAAS